MSFFVLSTWLNVKKILAKKVVIFAFFALPMVLVSLSSLLHNTTVATLHVGIAYDSAIPFHNQVVTKVADSVDNNPFITIVPFNDESALRSSVASNAITMGYIVPSTVTYADFVPNLITLVTSSNTIGDAVVNEIFAAALLDMALESITNRAFLFHFADSDADIFVREQIAAYRDSDIFMVPVFHSQDAYVSVEDVVNQSALRLMYGTVGMVILALVIFVVPVFIVERLTGVVVPLKGAKIKAVYNISVWAGMFVVMLVGFVLPSGLVLGAGSGFVFVVGLYAVFTVALVLGVSFFVNSGAIVQSFGVFVLLVNIFFGGVFVDMNQFNEGLGLVQRAFPLFWMVEMLIVM